MLFRIFQCILVVSLSAFYQIAAARKPLTSSIGSINYDGKFNNVITDNKFSHPLIISDNTSAQHPFNFTVTGSKGAWHSNTWFAEEEKFDITLGLLLGFGAIAGLKRAHNRKKLALV